MKPNNDNNMDNLFGDFIYDKPKQFTPPQINTNFNDDSSDSNVSINKKNDNSNITINVNVNYPVQQTKNNNKSNKYNYKNYRNNNTRNYNNRRNNYRNYKSPIHYKTRSPQSPRNYINRNNRRETHHTPRNYNNQSNKTTFQNGMQFTPYYPQNQQNNQQQQKEDEQFITNVFSTLFGLNTKKEENVKLEAPIEKENRHLDNYLEEHEDLPFKIETIDDLIEMADLYIPEKPYQYGINMKRLNLIKDTLKSFKNIIGMESVKKMIFDKIITYLQGLGDVNDMMHLVIQAPPGYGKTMVTYYISEIFYKLGIIKKSNKKKEATNNVNQPNVMILGATGLQKQKDNKEYYRHPFTQEKIDFPFVIARRSDLIGEYVGHTAPKVEKMVEHALGGVLVIDEVYSLGSKSNDSFSEECINTLNQLLSEYAGQFICVIAGYKEQIETNFFINPGLKRRFRMIINIDKYSAQNLIDIFKKMINDCKWNIDIDSKLLLKFMEKNKDEFKYCGGDMETLLQNCKDTHSKRVLGLHPNEKKIITIEDLNSGFELFKKFKDINPELNRINQLIYV